MASVRIVIIGDGYCGKTKLLFAWLSDTCSTPWEEFQSHMFFQQYKCNVKFNGVSVNVSLHDSPGQEEFNSLRSVVYNKADVVLVVFEVDDIVSFQNIKDKWIPHIRSFNQNVNWILVGTKSDLHRPQAVKEQNKKKTVLLKPEDIEALCKKYGMEYYETSAKTGNGVKPCMDAAVLIGLEFKYGKINCFCQMMICIYARDILRPFIVEQILPATQKDWIAFGVYIGYNKSTLKQPKYKLVNNPLWQILRFWTETVENLEINPFNILYTGLSKVNKSLARDLLERIIRRLEMIDKEEIKKCLKDNDIPCFAELKSRLGHFQFSDDDKIPVLIWGIGKNADDQYREVLQSGVENRYTIRLPIVGQFGAGKTCLTRRLLKKEIADVSSTNGIEIMTQKCKVRLTDETWIFSNDTRFDAIQGRKSRLIKNIMVSPIKGIPNQKQKTQERIADPNVSINEDQDTYANSNHRGEALHRISSDRDMTEYKQNITRRLSTKNVETNFETSEKTNCEHQSYFLAPATVEETDLLTDIKGWSENKALLDDFAEVTLLDFAGQYEFYATHQTFLNKHAIYLLVLDVSKNMRGLMASEDGDKNTFDMSEIPFEDIGEYINFWMDAIHCYGDDEQEIESTKEALPSIIVVGTCCDKLQIDKETRKCEIQEQFDKILGDHPKRKHIKDFIILSNTTSSESDFDVLRHRIVQQASKVETWGQQLPTRWIKYEQVLDQHRDNQVKVMSDEDIAELVKSVGLDIRDKSEIHLFLRYQHDVGNLIYFDDIPDLVILQPQWLVDVLKCLVSARKFQIQRNIVYNSDWQELETTGRLTEDLITQAFTGEKEGIDFLKYRRHILNIMEKFDIIVKPNMAIEESVATPGAINDSQISVVDYCVPCLIKSKPISNIVDSFKVDGHDCSRTSWICMNFDFLPPAFFNHVLVTCIRRYQISLEPSKLGCKLALYRGMGVFNLDISGRTKLAVCVKKKVILFQIWKWGKHSEVSFKGVWEHAKAIIIGIKGRYKMKVSYTVTMKCRNGSYDNPDGMVEMTKLESDEEYFCDEHAVLHKSKDLLDSWFKEELTAEMLNYVRLAKTVTDLMPEVMIEILKSDGFELSGNKNVTFRSLFISFQLQNKHKPTTGMWTSQVCPHEDTEIGIGDDVKRWLFILTELKNNSKISEEPFVAFDKVLANVFIRSEKIFEKYSFVSKYQKIMAGMFDTNDYDYYLQKVKNEIIPHIFEVNIRRHYQLIIQEISVCEILDQMMTHCMLSIDDRRHVEQHVRHIEQNQALLDIIIQRNHSTYMVFMDALRESGYDNIAELLSCDLEDITVNTRTAQMEGLSAWTVPLHKVRLQKNYVLIISSIKHEDIVDHLISCKLLSIDDQQTIEACPGQTEKNRKLMDKLLHCGEKCFSQFLNVLRSDVVYADLANQIEQTEVTSIDIATLQSCYLKM